MAQNQTPLNTEVKNMFVECHSMWVKDGVKYERDAIVDVIKNLEGTGITKVVKDKIIKAIKLREDK
jgi:hypothetical protein